MVKKLVVVISLLFIAGCSKQKENVEPEIKRENTIEYTIDSKRLPDKKILLETKKIIYRNGSVLGSQTILDTLPEIGNEQIQIVDEDEDENETVTSDTTVSKEYDIFFTIKGKK